MPDPDSPETDALLAGAEVELTAQDPPGGDRNLAVDNANSDPRQQKDQPPLTTDDHTQEQDSIVQPDNS